MERTQALPFNRGDTFYGPGATIDLTNLLGDQWCGKEKIVEDVDLSATTTIKPHRSGRFVYLRAVRNLSGVTLYGKEMVQVDTTFGTTITGRVVNDSQHGYPLDEFLPATGLPHGDIGFIVVEGPAMMKTPMTGAEFNGDIAVGARLHSVTTSGASTVAATTSDGGRVANFTVVAATTAGQFSSLLQYSANWVGVALTAVTTGGTNRDILVEIRRRY